jgi:hypothetical protein
MTETSILKWIKDNLSPVIIPAIQGTIYTEDWLGAMAYRETGELIARYAPKGLNLESISALMKGDYTQRHNDKQKEYHGFSFWQIDIDSFPDFVSSGDWKNPVKAVFKAVQVLEGKRKYIITHAQIQGDLLNRAITSAYNAGEGNAIKCISRKLDIDTYTTGHNYSKDVWRLREIYKTL